jgi:predicted glutamine amidotransferase
LTGNIIDIIDENCVEDYSNLMDELLKDSEYSAREPKYDTYLDYTLEEFKELLEKNSYWHNKCYVKINNKYVRYYIERYRDYWRYSYNKRDETYSVYTTTKGRKDGIFMREASPEQVYNAINPKYLVTYNQNKEIIKEWK